MSMLSWDCFSFFSLTSHNCTSIFITEVCYSSETTLCSVKSWEEHYIVSQKGRRKKDSKFLTLSYSVLVFCDNINSKVWVDAGFIVHETRPSSQQHCNNSLTVQATMQRMALCSKPVWKQTNKQNPQSLVNKEICFLLFVSRPTDFSENSNISLHCSEIQVLQCFFFVLRQTGCFQGSQDTLLLLVRLCHCF